MEDNQKNKGLRDNVREVVSILERDNIIPKDSNVVQIRKYYETHIKMRKGYKLLKLNHCLNKECLAYKNKKSPVGRFFMYVGENKFKPSKRIHICFYCDKCNTSFIYLSDLRDLMVYADNDLSNIKCISSREYQEIKKCEEDNKDKQLKDDINIVVNILRKRNFLSEDCDINILNLRYRNLGAKNKGCQNKKCSNYRSGDATCIGTYFGYKEKRPIINPVCYYCEKCNTGFIFKPAVPGLREYSEHNLNEIVCLTKEEYEETCKEVDKKEGKDVIEEKFEQLKDDNVNIPSYKNNLFNSYYPYSSKEDMLEQLKKKRKEREEKQEQLKKERNNIANNKDIRYATFLVRGDTNSCKRLNHNLTQIKAKSGLLIEKEQVEVIFDACYCEDCCAYYIENTTYNKLKRAGKLLCPIISKRTFENRKSLDTTSLSVQSKLSLSGYNVDSRFNLDDDYRKELLKNIVDSGVASVDEIVKLISFCITTHSNQAGYERAVEKWKKDLNEIRDYKSDDIYNVKKIITL